MILSETRDFLGSDWTRVGEIISDSLKSDIGLLEKTNAAILSNSGKQLRPMIALLVARACSSGPVGKSSLLCAAASELLHNATLLHDDVADGGNIRRGNPTTMSLLGSRASVLLGDFWLVRAVDCILAADDSNGTLIQVFSRTLSDLAEGEMLQIEKALSCDTTEDEYYRIVYCKTASLFRAAAVSAAISVAAHQNVVKAMACYAEMLGTAFQIRDDILDYSADIDSGKPAGVDILEKKITLPLLGAMENAGESRSAEIREKVSKIDVQPQYRDDILDFVQCFGGIEYSKARLSAFISRATESLNVLGNTREKEYLVKIAEFINM